MNRVEVPKLQDFPPGVSDGEEFEESPLGREIPRSFPFFSPLAHLDMLYVCTYFEAPSGFVMDKALLPRSTLTT